MNLFILFLPLFISSVVESSSFESYGREVFPLLMPDVQPTQRESYFCTAFRLPQDEHKYVVEFTPHASKDTAHHILLYGCEVPGFYERDAPRAVWDCGEMAKTRTSLVRAPTCSKGSTIIYAWAMDAPKLTLPDEVAFKIGGKTGINFLVLQVHYANVDKFVDGATDNSGIVLSLLPANTNLISKRAGVLLLGTGGSIPSNSVEHMETECQIREDTLLHPFAFRTHTHKLGKAVSGWRVDPQGNWRLIGKHDPQQPQMFYPVEDKSLVIRQYDRVAARCTMNNTLNHDVLIGSTGDDEMCNFYMMYYVDGDRTLDMKYCFSMGPPYYHWDTDNKLHNHVPSDVDRDASAL